MRSAVPNAPVLLAARMFHDDWPGVLVAGDGWRVVVNGPGTRYAIQRQGLNDLGGFVWVGRSYNSLRGLLAGSDLPAGLGAAVAGVPDDPSQARPELTAALSAAVSNFAAAADAARRQARVSKRQRRAVRNGSPARQRARDSASKG